MERIFVDTDVVLDLLSARDPHYQHAAELFSLSDKGKISLYISALSFANLNYILSKQITQTKARKLLLKFKTLVQVLPVDDKIIDLSLVSDFTDFEDAIQHHTAVENDIKILLTRNIRDYKKADITIMTAQEYLQSSQHT